MGEEADKYNNYGRRASVIQAVASPDFFGEQNTSFINQASISPDRRPSLFPESTN
jgi:hypothetical protein